MKRINYVLSHPIQYQSPLINYLVKKGINIKVFYRSTKSLNGYYDIGFKKKIKWDINLLKGHKYDFLKFIGPNKTGKIFPLTVEIFKIFKDTNYIWLHGIKNWYSLSILFINFFYKKKVLIREEIQNTNNHRSNLNMIFNKIFYKIIKKFVFKFLIIGKENKNFYLEMGIDNSKMILIPYVVNNDFFIRKKNHIKKKKNKLNILLASKFEKKKGIDIFLKSIDICNMNNKFKSMTNIIIIGNGLEENKLKKFVRENDLNNVNFKIFQNQKKLKKYYHKSDIFVLPSRYEPWGLTINEALACKNLVITSKNIGASKDLIKNNFNGFIFNDYKHLSKILLKIFKKRKIINQFKDRGFKIIKKWNFELCYKNLSKTIND